MSFINDPPFYSVSDLNEDQVFAFEDIQICRSSEWKKKRLDWIAKNSRCVCCLKRINLNVHHIKPFHLFPELELEDSNLITLCEGGPINCHYLAGHCGISWTAYSQNVHNSIHVVRNLLETLRTGRA